MKYPKKYRRDRPKTHDQRELDAAKVSFFLKGGYIRILAMQMTYDVMTARKVRRGIDWGYIQAGREVEARRRQKTRLAWQVFDYACGVCGVVAPTKGRDRDHALERAWKKGWLFLDDAGAFCPDHKPVGRGRGKFKPGDRVHSRAEGKVFTVVRFLRCGEHPINESRWPELWVEDRTGREMVFILWENKIPEELVKL